MQRCIFCGVGVGIGVGSAGGTVGLRRSLLMPHARFCFDVADVPLPGLESARGPGFALLCSSAACVRAVCRAAGRAGSIGCLRRSLVRGGAGCPSVAACDCDSLGGSSRRVLRLAVVGCCCPNGRAAGLPLRWLMAQTYGPLLPRGWWRAYISALSWVVCPSLVLCSGLFLGRPRSPQARLRGGADRAGRRRIKRVCD
eukprot:15035445-Alexandrium_andersonii.AAC.2